MALYAIGDLHLAFGSKIKSPAQRESRLWRGHEQRFMENCRSVMTEEDTIVLLGDHTWGRKLQDSEQDLEFIAALPGRKILLRGNHDSFWDVKKTDALNERYKGKLFFLQSNYAPYHSASTGDIALVGTKGFCFEGPFYLNRRGQIIGWDEENYEHAQKLVKRESERLEASFAAARTDGYSKFIMFLHYPPTNVMEKESAFTEIAEKHHVQQVIYAHCHGEERFHDSIQGEFHGIRYSLASGDFLRWMPMKVCE